MSTLNIEHRCGCVLLFSETGSIPLSSILKISKLAPKGSILDTDVARMSKAFFVTGRPQDLAVLKAELAPEVRARVRKQYPQLPADAQEWLATGEQGISSQAIFQAATGIEISGLKSSSGNYPRDPSDLRRCILLIESVSGVKSGLTVLADQSMEWAGLMSSWSTLTAVLQQETPGWRSSGGSAPKTYAAMQIALNPPVAMRM